MKAEIKDGNLVVTIEVNNPYVLSKTGKSKLIATSHGNHATTLIVDGKPVIVGLTAYTKN